MTQAELGRLGEDLALAFYQVHGFRCRARRWRRAGGEIDLVVERAGLVVFVEVKSRGPGSVTRAPSAVPAGQLRRLRRLVGLWCREHHDWRELRLDVVALDVLPEGRGLALRHFPDAG